jgi:NAD(P)-dependent dehydrogenase (short-subunit alcohol dehydrogenase family)
MIPSPLAEPAFGAPRGHVLVVGGGSGIGLEFVRQLLADPGVEKVYASQRRPSEELAQLNSDPRLQIITLDLTQEDQIVGAIAQIQRTTPKLNLAINTVGLLHSQEWQPEKNLRQLNSDQLTRYFQVNSIGPILLAKHLLPLFKHSEIALLATLSAKVGSIGDNHLGGWYGYRASKSALNMLFKTAAIEYKRSCPRTILALLHPGTTDTPLSQPFQRSVPAGKLFTPQRTVAQLLTVMAGLTPERSGQFWSWDGTPLPW